MSVDSKVLIILKDPNTNPMSVVKLIEKRLNQFVLEQNKEMPLNFDKTHPERYNLIQRPLDINEEHLNQQYGFIYFRYYSPDQKNEYIEGRTLYFGWGDYLNEENKEYDFINPNKKLMKLSTGDWGKNKEFIQEIISEINHLCENIYVDINDCDDIDYEDQKTFFKKYGSKLYLLKWL